MQLHNILEKLLREEMQVACWNVEGLSDIKVWEITAIMKRPSSCIVCLHETRILKTMYYYTQDVVLITLSVSSTEEKVWAGVGFVIADQLSDYCSSPVDYAV